MRTADATAYAGSSSAPCAQRPPTSASWPPADQEATLRRPLRRIRGQLATTKAEPGHAATAQLARLGRPDSQGTSAAGDLQAPATGDDQPLTRPAPPTSGASRGVHVAGQLPEDRKMTSSKWRAGGPDSFSVVPKSNRSAGQFALLLHTHMPYVERYGRNAGVVRA
jgi:hypothetical protein